MIAATMARLMARRGHLILAIDCDSDPNLAMSAGLPEHVAGRMKAFLDQSGDTRRLPRASSAARLIREYGVVGPDNITLLLAARAERAGAG